MDLLRERCNCGRKLLDAEKRVFSSSGRHFTYHRCECGHEWTDSEADVDHRDPVSSDEVLEVHKRMKSKQDVPLDELTR